MKRRFILAVEGMTKDQQTKFVEWIKTKRMGWWHWIDGFWLLTSRSEEVSCADIRDQVRDITNRKNNLVMEIAEDLDWAGLGPDTNDKSMFRWLKESWPL